MSQIFNPFLPNNEYIPDPEVHVFEDRVYLYGSHDRFDGKDYCEGDYVCWSAPIHNLKDWKYEGVILKKEDHQGTKGNLYAPDVAKGLDGRFYLYYSVADSSIISVAVSDTPAGKYAYYGDIQYSDGTKAGTREGDYFEFDPAVLVDDGKIYLYSGSGQSTKEKHGKEVVGLFVRELEADMLTIKTEPMILMEAEDDRQKSNFFEGASMRKINGLYYLIFFATNISGLNYCTSQHPDKDFQYRGIIHSSADIGLNGRPLSNAASMIGNNHGCIEVINGRTYVFNHRHTNRTSFSRQTVAEEISIADDGSIDQVESTSNGLNDGPLTLKGVYPAYIACNIMAEANEGRRNPFDAPFVTEEETGESYIKGIKNNGLIGFKYFEFEHAETIKVTVRGEAKGTLDVLLEEEGEPFESIPIDINMVSWETIEKVIHFPATEIPIYFSFNGEGALDFKSFEIA